MYWVSGHVRQHAEAALYFLFTFCRSEADDSEPAGISHQHRQFVIILFQTEPCLETTRCFQRAMTGLFIIELCGEPSLIRRTWDQKFYSRALNVACDQCLSLIWCFCLPNLMDGREAIRPRRKIFYRIILALNESHSSGMYKATKQTEI